MVVALNMIIAEDFLRLYNLPCLHFALLGFVVHNYHFIFSNDYIFQVIYLDLMQLNVCPHDSFLGKEFHPGLYGKW